MKKAIKRYSFVFVLALTICIGILILTKNKSVTKEACTPNKPVFIEAGMEVDSKFMITPDTGIVFSGNPSESFGLYKYRKGQTEAVKPAYKDVFSPYFIQGKIGGLKDSLGDGQFVPTDKELQKYVQDKTVEKIFSFRNGNLFILKFKNDLNVYLLKLEQASKEILFTIRQKIHSVVLGKENNILIISFDDKLLSLDLNTNKKTAIKTSIKGEKLNLFIYKSQLFFVSNFQSNFYRIYKTDLEDAQNKTELVHETPHELRLPKLKDNYLYYLEIINSEYLLKQLDIETRSIRNITQKGVVYDYAFYKEEEILMAYSDLHTPRSLILYKSSNNSYQNISGTELKHGLSYQLVWRASAVPPAYLLMPPDQQEIKGIILFFHPGLHSDYSPRWDPVLMNLSYNGFMVLAPNYPMSSGYGKEYNNSDLSQAVEDMVEWKRDILAKYKVSLYYLSASSGNILMELCLLHDDKEVMAAGALFGIPLNNDIPNLKVPTLFVLGEHDPIINFQYRNKQLQEAKASSPISIASYPDEGHWFRKSKNSKDVVKRLLEHFCSGG